LCDTYECVTSYTWYVSHHIMICVTSYTWYHIHDMCHIIVAHSWYVSHHIMICVTSYTWYVICHMISWMSHVTHRTESWHTYIYYHLISNGGKRQRGQDDAGHELRHVRNTHVCDMTLSDVWHGSFAHVLDFTHSCVTSLIHVCDMPHSCMWHHLFMCVTWLIHVCDINYSCVWRD